MMKVVLEAVKLSPIAAVGAALSFLTLSLVFYTQIVRPKVRRRKLRRPCDPYFIVTSADRRRLGYVTQDAREHFLKELIVSAQREIPIEILLKWRVSFRHSELVFGFDDKKSISEKPVIERFFTPFVVRGSIREGSPEDNPNHYVDHHGNYHIRENREVSMGTFRSIGFIIKTGIPGIHEAIISFGGEEVKGQVSLRLRVEDNPSRAMICSWPGHRKCQLLPISTPKE